MSIDTATQALLTAMVTRYNSSDGNAIRTAGSTDVYYGSAPKSAVYPFIVLNIPAAVDEPTIGQGTSGGAIYEDINVNAAAYDDSRDPDRALSIIGQWHTAFNFVTLSLASPYKQIIGRRVNGPLPIENPDQKGWQCVSTYEYNVAE